MIVLTIYLNRTLGLVSPLQAISNCGCWRFSTQGKFKILLHLKDEIALMRLSKEFILIRFYWRTFCAFYAKWNLKLFLERKHSHRSESDSLKSFNASNEFKHWTPSKMPSQCWSTICTSWQMCSTGNISQEYAHTHKNLVQTLLEQDFHIISFQTLKWPASEQ